MAKQRASNVRKYLAFDIETAKQTPGDFSQWRQHRPLGICCAATCPGDGEPMLWHSKTTQGSPANRMTTADARALLDHLIDRAKAGYTLLTWNGASFDFDVLAEEAQAHADCRGLVHDHVDMMFHVVCQLGYPVAMEKVAEGMGLSGKAGGMSGAEAPKLWAKGKHEQVLAYVTQDVRLALQIAAEGERQRSFSWITQKGVRRTQSLPGGWKTVRHALTLPLPDTSWMKTPLRREDFLAWLTSE
ncbi:MAG: ribonuclease H-like domain-containing protein [Planctomycetes bacterium]|nr:ribonuclease H-like domain-containing protein [Planctomycetota bacterium]